eukprot:TRINITY_DN3197_c0_g1_i1.p1 TRINITY_DN3197_c0_g1~~TRINITY_DN3197_c0_g1_i1.p1  ORF type:complete len:117 (-),score=2.24 TRINITY_DN3197_c0_g1_i1:127-477(-)
MGIYYFILKSFTEMSISDLPREILQSASLVASGNIAAYLSKGQKILWKEIATACSTEVIAIPVCGVTMTALLKHSLAKDPLINFLIRRYIFGVIVIYIYMASGSIARRENISLTTN